MERARSDLEHMLVDETAKPMPLPLSLLEHITGGFSNDQEIGWGGCAVVYKGILSNGTVAVKKLFDSLMDEKVFHREIQCLMKIKHKNAVRFLGYCADTQGNMEMYDGEYVMADVYQRLLVFEYIPKGGLYKYIADTRREWAMCYKIIKEICEGIQYLHDNRIVHLDLKPANILLDDNMSPKICDFGLSRCFKENQSKHITETRAGTLGYIAPELREEGVISFSADLYSLGVVIIEILTGHRLSQDNKEVLESWSHRLERSQRDKLCMQIQVSYQIALQCIDNNPKKRPDSVQTIIHRLHVIEVLYDAKKLSIEVSTGALAFHTMYGVELMKISDVSRNTLSDLELLNSLRSLRFRGCSDTFFSKQDDTTVPHSVQNLELEGLPIAGKLFVKVLRCFSALSHLTITKCKSLEFSTLEDGGLSNLRMLQSFTACGCGRLFRFPRKINMFSWWPVAINPFPTSLRELKISFEESMQSMGLLSNLTSLTSLEVTSCKELTMDGFNPLITANLKKLCIDTMYSYQEEGISIAGDLLSEIARSKVMQAGSFQLEELWVDSISAVLTAPICSHLGATLHTLEFSYDQQMTTFTEEQEHTLQLLTSLQYLNFEICQNLRSLPRGLHGLSSLKRLVIFECKKIVSLPPKEDLPTSLENLRVYFCSPEVIKQAEKLKEADPWFSVHTLGWSQWD